MLGYTTEQVAVFLGLYEEQLYFGLFCIILYITLLNAAIIFLLLKLRNVRRRNKQGGEKEIKEECNAGKAEDANVAKETDKIENKVEQEVNMEREIIVRGAVKREKGYLYYIDKDGNILRSRMGRLKKVEEEEAMKEAETIEKKLESGESKTEEESATATEEAE